MVARDPSKPRTRPTARDINEMSSVEIREEIKKLRADLMHYNGVVKGKKQTIENPMIIRETKRTLARMITILIKRGEPVTVAGRSA